MTLPTATALRAGDLINAVTGAATTDATPAVPIADGKHQSFALTPKAGGDDYTLNIHGLGDGTNLPTTLSVTLYASSDGGNTFAIYGATNNPASIVATSVATDQQILHLVCGLVYQLAVTTLTLGSATSVSVKISVS